MGETQTWTASGLLGRRPGNSDAPEGFRDQPMCVNMIEKYDAQLSGDPEIAQNVNEEGWSLLHQEALAG
jgi:hypothetical protein